MKNRLGNWIFASFGTLSSHVLACQDIARTHHCRINAAFDGPGLRGTARAAGSGTRCVPGEAAGVLCARRVAANLTWACINAAERAKSRQVIDAPRSGHDRNSPHFREIGELAQPLLILWHEQFGEVSDVSSGFRACD
jgi:hypothetical protein